MRDGKGGKDRATLLATSVKDELRKHLARVDETRGIRPQQAAVVAA